MNTDKNSVCDPRLWVVVGGHNYFVPGAGPGRVANLVANLPHNAASPQPNVGRTPPSAPDPLVRLFLCSSKPAGQGARPTRSSLAAKA